MKKFQKFARYFAFALVVVVASVARAEYTDADLSALSVTMTDAVSLVKDLVFAILTAGAAITIGMWAYRRLKGGLNRS